MSNKIKIWFFYPSGPRLTGQELASRLILDVFKDVEDIDFRIVKLVAFDRELRSSAKHWLKIAASMFNFFYQMVMSAVNRNSVIYLNLGQSIKSLLLEGVPFSIIGMFNPWQQSVISLHGHLFTGWSPGSIKGILFRWILGRSNKVTVLGPSQKAKLTRWGLAQKMIHIVNNTCEGVIENLQQKKNSITSVNLLYLSNIIETKGYREYLKALLLLSQMKLDRKVNAVMCGQFIKSSLEKGKNLSNAIAWTNKIIGMINDSSNVRIYWMKGAYGAEKANLYGRADILVFPSRYRVEAQPIVIIEGMAAGCAIIASSVGEIPTMLAADAGLCLNDCSPVNVANAIFNLVNNPQELRDKQKRARRLYESRFSRKVYAKKWRSIFRELCQKPRKHV